MANVKLDFIHSYFDKGHLRQTFRRHGRRTTIRGQPGSPEFMAQYYTSLEASGGAPQLKRRASKPPTDHQPLIGVYLLMLKGRIVYIGSSLRMPERVADHRANGRPFSHAFYIATRAHERKPLEDLLIQALRPLQNRKGMQ